MHFLCNVEEQLKNALLTSPEKCLMDVLFGKELTREKIHILIDDYDIDRANQNYSLMLACLGYKENWRMFPEEIIPRLKGIHRYYQVRNSIGIPWLLQQLRTLSDAGIPVMLIKGIAMRAYYARGTPRLMWDYDIAVPEEQYQRSIQLLCKGKNFLKGEWRHSGTISNGVEELDVHHWIFKGNEDKNTDFWKRAVHFDYYGIDVCVPSPEDMFLHQLDIQLYNWARNEASERRMKWLYDCRCIWSFLEEEDIYELPVRAEELHIKYKMGIMFRLYACCFPELIPQTMLDESFAPTKEEGKWLKKWAKFRRVFGECRKYDCKHGTGVAMTPWKVFLLMRVEAARYHYYKPELRRSDPDINIWRYFKQTRDLNNFGEAVCFLIKLFRVSG